MSDEEKLLEYGFPPDKVKRALQATNNAGVQAALDWLAEHQDDNSDLHSEGPVDNDPKSLRCNDCQKLFSTVELAQLHAAKSGHQDFSESNEVRPELTPEQKSERLAELRSKLAEKRKIDQLKAEQESKEAELLRRKSGHTAAQARRELQEKEMIKAAEQMRKDREEEKVIRARIRAEMEEERRQRKVVSTMTEQPQAEPIKLVSQDSDSVRIQVKLPGGESLKAVFKSSDKLACLLDKVSEKVSVHPSNKFVIPFPHKVIEISADAEKTFMELGLCPSASLVFE